jgi:hypothetical protein
MSTAAAASPERTQKFMFCLVLNFLSHPIIIIIIIISFYSLVEHRARVKIRHLVLFAAKAFTLSQLFFSGFNSFSTVHRHVVLGHPLFLVPCGFHSNAALEISLGGFLSICPIHFHFLF